MAGGRPKADTATRRESVVAVRLTVAERAALEARAASAGLPLPDYMRAALVEAKPPRARRNASSQPVLSLDELDRLDGLGVEFRAIGNNLNQIARALNIGTSSPISDDVRGEIGALTQARARLDSIFARFLP